MDEVVADWADLQVKHGYRLQPPNDFDHVYQAQFAGWDETATRARFHPMSPELGRQTLEITEEDGWVIFRASRPLDGPAG
ncbi:hypothetical protein ABCS02_33555 [Microbacterium sp. X-17]|uniref:hypothetical protein n=1 Tax=Microbacterium sp. X-17 TaxID=3144404 RepID=UPI0031F47F1B